jgi:DNA-binding NtrC family response regulator
MTDKEEISAEDVPLEETSLSSETKGLPELSREGVDLDKVVEEIEKRYLFEALRLTHGVKTEAADLLKLSFRSFRHRLQKYEIK